MSELNAIVDAAQTAFAQAATPADLENAKALFLGKAGRITELMKGMGALSVDEKKSRGAAINQAKQAIEAALNGRRQALADAQLELQLKAEALDVSLPGRKRGLGSLHPVSLSMERIEQIFASMGFDVADGPEIENDWYNFGALNFPEDHPARAMHDTFYVEGGYLLRTHTSSVQIRTMEQQAAPIRIICPGRVYRCDSDQTHSPMFHQVEGLVIAKDASFAELKGLIVQFLQVFFEKELKVRFRPSYFPFTEPSAEVDIMDERGRWLEVLGCGMVHPNVLTSCGIDPHEYKGFAFGLGVERFAMLRYDVNDLRLFFQNDVRFLKQFA